MKYIKLRRRNKNKERRNSQENASPAVKYTLSNKIKSKKVVSNTTACLLIFNNAGFYLTN
jgi:hypothetical protein